MSTIMKDQADALNRIADELYRAHDIAVIESAQTRELKERIAVLEAALSEARAWLGERPADNQWGEHYAALRRLIDIIDAALKGA